VVLAQNICRKNLDCECKIARSSAGARDEDDFRERADPSTTAT